MVFFTLHISYYVAQKLNMSPKKITMRNMIHLTIPNQIEKGDQIIAILSCAYFTCNHVINLIKPELS